MRVLLVDDAEGMRKIIASMLKTMGYDEVITAANGKEALQRLEVTDVGLLLTNWSMPLELVRAVRATNTPSSSSASRPSCPSSSPAPKTRTLCSSWTGSSPPWAASTATRTRL